MAADNHDQVLGQLQAHGLVVSSLDTSGRIVRVDCEDRPGKKHGWYVAHEITLDDGRVFIVGRYGDLRAGEGGQGNHDTGRAFNINTRLSPEEREQVKVRRAEQRQKVAHERAALAAEAARRAASIWATLPTEGRSPYLQRKRVRAWGLRFARGAVVVPLVNVTSGELVGLQFIDESGEKRFLTGTAKRGACHWVGGESDAAGVLALAEGYATAATVHEATGWPVACAFDAGNLGSVAAGVRAKFPAATIVIAGDDDHVTPGNPGRTRAGSAVAAVGGIAVFPRFTEPAGRTDFNDLHSEQGLDAVRDQLQAALEAATQRVTADEVLTAVAAEAEVLAACARAAITGTRSRQTSLRREALAWRRLTLFRKKLHELRR